MKSLKADSILNFKKYLDTSKDNDFALDLTSMNIFDSLQFAVLSSAYFYQKFPGDKLKCKIQSEDIKSLLTPFDVKNLEFV